VRYTPTGVAKVSGRYEPAGEQGFHWEDPQFGINSGLDASKAGDRVSREIGPAYLKPPDRGVPLPRSGQSPLAAGPTALPSLGLRGFDRMQKHHTVAATTDAYLDAINRRAVNSPRVLWLSPLMRPLARVQAEALRQRGVDVLLVTSDQHPESDTARDYELVLDPRFRTASTWPATLAAWRELRAYRPDVVITELVRDPRWIALAGRAPRIQLVHDERPHDTVERRPAYEHAVFDRWGSGAAATITYSNYAAVTVATRRDVIGTRVHVLPLTSDLDPTLVPPLVDPNGRRDFLMLGRLQPYKNIDVVLEAWQRHVDGGGWRGDELVLIGDGPLILRSLPEYVRWRPGRYRYSDIVGTVAAAKGAIAHYRCASQSGVQVLSMQLGVMPIVSTAGGLPEYQPPGCPPIGIDDVAGLAAAFDELADPFTATLLGASAARHYAERFTLDCAVDGLWKLLTEVLSR
jgi:glycosyltransferase involved in cell wall biosynthesis